MLYPDLANWFGLPPGVTQNNPTGIASTDGTNFWGTGNVTGTSSEAAGTLFYNGNVSPTPMEIAKLHSRPPPRPASSAARFMSWCRQARSHGVYNFLDPENNDAVVPLPYDPNVPNPVEHMVLTNLFINWGSTFTNIANFDMNPAGTIAYGADQTSGIVKFTNNGGVWPQAPYYFSTTNIGTTNQTCGQPGLLRHLRGFQRRQSRHLCDDHGKRHSLPTIPGQSQPKPPHPHRGQRRSRHESGGPDPGHGRDHQRKFPRH